MPADRSDLVIQQAIQQKQKGLSQIGIRKRPELAKALNIEGVDKHGITQRGARRPAWQESAKQ